MAKDVRSDVEDGVVSSVVSDEKVTDPDSELAVQIPEAANGERDALSVHKEPSPNEVAEQGLDATLDADAEREKEAAAQAEAEEEEQSSSKWSKSDFKSDK